MHWPSWEEWYASLSDTDRARADALLARFVAAGAHEPESWVRSELQEDIPQLARFLFLKPLWPNIIDRYRDDLEWLDAHLAHIERHPNCSFADAGRALRHLLDAGAKRSDLAAIARYIAYGAVFDVLYALDGGYDDLDLSDGYPGSVLMETDSTGHLTGRAVASLHESLLDMDPTGREGRPA